MKMKVPNLAALVAAFILGPTSVWAQGQPDPDRYAYGPHMMWWGGEWPAMIFGPLLMILMVAAVIALVVVLVRSSVGSPSYQGPHTRTPLDILKERFARGEIDQQEYEDRRRTLSEGAD